MSVIPSTNVYTPVEFRCSVQQKCSLLWCVQMVLCGSWSGREAHSGSCFVTPAEAICVEGLSGGMLPSSLWHCGFLFLLMWPYRLRKYLAVPGKPQGFSSSEMRALTLSAHKENAVRWKNWTKRVCRFVCAVQAVVVAEPCRETALFGSRGGKFFHQDCCSTFLKYSSTLLAFG